MEQTVCTIQGISVVMRKFLVIARRVLVITSFFLLLAGSETAPTFRSTGYGALWCVPTH
jgi:hypothetical protein